MSGGGGASPRKAMTLDDLVEALDRRERAPSNVPKVDTFHFKREWVSDWLDSVEQALVGLSDEVKFRRILRYVLHGHHQEVRKVVDAANDRWARFKERMLRKYRLGDGLLTTADLEAMNKDDFTMIGAFVQEFKKKARKVHGISEEAQCAIFLGLLTASKASEFTSHGGGSEKLIWATIDKGVEDGNLEQVEQHQMRLQRRKRKERDATASGTPRVKRIVTDVLAEVGYGNEVEVQKRVVTVAQGRVLRVVDEEAGHEDYDGEETGSQALTKAPRKQRNLLTGGQDSGKGKAPQAVVAPLAAAASAPMIAGPLQMGPPTAYGKWMPYFPMTPWPPYNPCTSWGGGQNFAAKTEHLRKVVRQDQEWVWGGDQEEAVKRMKEEFKEGGLVLGAPNYEVTEEKSFTIETDAGPTALGGVLVQADAEGKERLLRSDFPKTVMQRGGRGTRPRQRPQGASRGDDQRRPFGRESTPVFDDDNIKLFLDTYHAHATREGWSTLEKIRNLRGVERFEEPIAHIREEALTWSDVEARMQRLRASPVGRDGLPIRLEEGNAEEFIPAYEQYMRDQGTTHEEWMQTLLLWTRRAERSFARQLQDRARDWEDCQAQLRQAFRRPEPERPEPRVERSKRPWDPEARRAVVARRGRKALAQREEESAEPAQATEPHPNHGLEQVEFRQITGSDLRDPSPKLPEEGEGVPFETPLGSLEAHLDASQWGTSQLGAGPVEPAWYELAEELQGPDPGTEQCEPGELQEEEVITVGDDTPPHTPAPEQVQRPSPEGIPESDSEEILVPPPEIITSPPKGAEPGEQEESERAGARTTVASQPAEHAAEHLDTEMPVSDEPPPQLPHAEEGVSAEVPLREVHEARARRLSGETTEEKSARVQARLTEIYEKKIRMEAAGEASIPPTDPGTSEQRIGEAWARYEGRKDAGRLRSRAAGQEDEKADKVRETRDLGFSAAGMGIERAERRIRQAATTSFQRYTILNDELAASRLEVE
ncbi:hypothetical protein CBR_g25954 [Chara braunii]|uniref:Reverse transcriptase/retrotransposon-derived protein RNase H-like domain-containing protein n=1 Tax=Chara braunii TaxID=69332 RepID=A0A388L6T0_CHABU|nr:hypothetical protein CBR_g25954 [Chara braunii]|eukprot:GBG78020.1 hypothetical protein CBR_g25954 [Chara braunii]